MAQYKWMFHVDKAHLTDENKRTACGRTLETVDPPSESWDGKSHKCVTCEKFEQKQKQNEPKYDPLSSPFGADSFYSEYCREFSGLGAER